MDNNLLISISDHLHSCNVPFELINGRLSTPSGLISISKILPKNQPFWHTGFDEYAVIPSGLANKTLSPLVIASTNQGKLEEYKMLLHSPWVSIDKSDLFAIEALNDVPEDACTFAENALQKSFYTAQSATQSNCWVLADDSGFCLSDVDWNDVNCQVDGAKGVFPGVYTKRFAKKICAPDAIDYKKACAWINENFGISHPAHYQCAIAISLSGPITESWVFTSSIEGQTVSYNQGDSGFGFDPIFMPSGHQKTFSQMRSRDKNLISHRALAVKLLERNFSFSE